MKHFLVVLSVLLVFLTASSYSQTNIYKLINPLTPFSHSKYPADGPPFLRFGSAQQSYYIDDPNSMYNDHINAVTSAFNKNS